jgi:hypothetical protein
MIGLILYSTLLIGNSYAQNGTSLYNTVPTHVKDDDDLRDTLCSKSDTIMIVSVSSVSYTPIPPGYLYPVYTKAQLNVERYIKGTYSQTSIELNFPGGEVNDRFFRVSGFPDVFPGARFALALDDEGLGPNNTGPVIRSHMEIDPQIFLPSTADIKATFEDFCNDI